MKKFSAIIVDDEHYAREIIKLLLVDEPDFDIVGECSNGAEAIKVINNLHPDLVFLDIQMPEIDGFEVIKNIDSDYTPHFIFVTAFDEYALRAFDVNAIDYLLKPYDDDRFRDALIKAKRHMEQYDFNKMNDKLSSLLTQIELKENDHINNQSISKIPVKNGSRIYFVNVDSVDWIEAADQYVKLHTGEKYHLIRESMNRLEEKLSTKSFFRIHRSTIINIDRVKELQPYSKGDYIVILINGTTLRMSRNRKDKLQQMLGW